jgi:hypothetical protein
VWVDTVGYDDTTNSNDADSFREVLHYLNDQNLASVRAVVWTVLPQVGNNKEHHCSSLFAMEGAKVCGWGGGGGGGTGPKPLAQKNL